MRIHDPSRVEIIAHRGATSETRENTLDAIERAIELGADRIEMDVRRLGDGTLVLHHNPGPPGVTLADLDIAGLPRLEQLHGYRIPTLEQVLRAFSGRVLWDIELKETGYEAQVVEQVTGFITPPRFVLSSFHDESLRLIRREFPQIEVALILGTDEPKYGIWTRLGELYPMRRAARCGAATLAVDKRFLRYGFLNHLGGFRGVVWVWTVNQERELRKMFRTPGVSGVITDDVALALRIRSIT